MKKLILLAGAVLLVGSASALARPGKGNPHTAAAQGQRAIHSAHGQGRRDDALARRSRELGSGEMGSAYGYGRGGCPPGLAKKSPACIPPGQAKKIYAEGQRLPYGYRGYTDYDRIPLELRDRYGLDPQDRYIYNDDYLYQVDPTTLIVEQVLRSVL